MAYPLATGALGYGPPPPPHANPPPKQPPPPPPPAVVGPRHPALQPRVPYRGKTSTLPVVVPTGGPQPPTQVTPGGVYEQALPSFSVAPQVTDGLPTSEASIFGGVSPVLLILSGIGTAAYVLLKERQ